MVLTLDGVSTSLTIKVYKTVTVTCNFIGFPGVAYDQRNASIGFYLHIGVNDPRIVGPFYINPVNRNATSTFESTLFENDRIRGVVTYRVRAEWYSSTGDVSSSYSNQVTATWIDP